MTLDKKLQNLIQEDIKLLKEALRIKLGNQVDSLGEDIDKLVNTFYNIFPTSFKQENLDVFQAGLFVSYFLKKEKPLDINRYSIALQNFCDVYKSIKINQG